MNLVNGQNSGATSSMSIHQLPTGWAWARIFADEGATARVAVPVRDVPANFGGRLPLLRLQDDAAVYLAALVDATGTAHRWLELEVQQTDRLAGSAAASREHLTNAVLDERWRLRFETLRTLAPHRVLGGGFKTERPAPIVLDGESLAPRPLSGPDGWRPCTDDAVLTSAGLPPYRTTVHRYLYQPSRDDTRFVRLSEASPRNERTVELSEFVGGGLSLNAGGGLMLLRSFDPLSLDAYLRLLDAMPGPTQDPDASLPIAVTAVTEADSANWLFLGAHGRWGRLVERFHLRLSILRQAVGEVAEVVRLQQRPHLALDETRFRVSLGEAANGLPRMWTGRVHLVDTGAAVAAGVVDGGEASLFTSLLPAAANVFRPAAQLAPARSTATVRVRRIDDVQGGTTIEGTLFSHDRLAPSRSDIAVIALPCAGATLSVRATLESDRALGPGEWRFRSLAMSLTPQQVESLRSSAGVAWPDTPLEMIAALSSPCDLYALGVLAVRLLLVNRKNTLPEALDETLSLARQVAAAEEMTLPLPDRVRQAMASDERWAASLGPQRLSQEDMTPAEAWDLVPEELWCATLATILRMFPGVGPDSVCRDFGDARPGGLHRVFDPSLADLDLLLVRSRSLVVVDWRFNREVQALLRRYLAGLDDLAVPTGSTAGR